MRAQFKDQPQLTGCELVTLKGTYLHVETGLIPLTKKVCCKLRCSCGIPKGVGFLLLIDLHHKGCLLSILFFQKVAQLSISQVNIEAYY